MAQPRGIRLKDKDDIEINQIAKQQGTTFSTVISNIISNYLHIEKSKMERGDITLAGEIIKNRHESIKKSDIGKIAIQDAKFIIKEMEMQTDVDFNEISKRILEWNNIENKLRLVKRERRESVIFIGQHRLGRTWSEIQCKMYCNMFELVGETIIPNSTKFDGTSFQFEIIKHETYLTKQ